MQQQSEENVSKFAVNIPQNVGCEFETDREFEERWAKIDALSEDQKNILGSTKTSSSLDELENSLSLNREEIADISRLIRTIIFSELKIEQLDMILGKHFSRLGVAEISKIKETILRILNQRPEDSQEPDTSVKLSLTDALAKFPKLGEQQITSAPLKLRIFPEMVKPSVKNWIADFHDALGRGKHGTIERGNYLFHGENTKRLTSLERRRLAEVLKSLGDTSTLSIDPQSQKIVFESRTQEFDAPARSEAPLPPVRPAALPQLRPVQMASQRTVPPRAEIFRPANPVSPQFNNDKKIENYFGGSSASRTAHDLNSSMRQETIAPKMSAPVFQKPASVPRPVRENLSIGNTQERYEIPKTQNPKPVTRNLEPESYSLKPITHNLEPSAYNLKPKTQNLSPKWNPAENVKKRMAEESSSFGSSQISQPAEEIAVNPQGNLRFSSPHTLPIEKKQEALKTLPPSAYALPAKPAESPVAKPVPIAQAPVSKPSFAIPPQGEDDLIAKMRALKSRPSQQSAPRSAFKITPMGFVKKNELETNADEAKQGPKVSGNVVDLR